jgi:hypothetical protein
MVVDQSGVALRDAEIRWASSDGAIVAIDPWGYIDAIAEGSAEIIATYGSLTASVPVTVLPEVRDYIQKVEFTETSGSYHKSRGNINLSLRVFDGTGYMTSCNGANSLPVSASSSNEAVATVVAIPAINNCRLPVTLNQAGTATITLTINGSSATYDLTVTDGSLTIGWSADFPSDVVAGDTVSFSAIVTNENGDPVEGRTVHFDRSRGTLLESEAVTDANGVATVRWTAPTSLRFIAVLNVVTATITAATENLGGMGRISDSQSITIDRGKPASLSFFHLDPDLNRYMPVSGDTLTLETGANRVILLVTYDKHGNFVNSSTSSATMTPGGTTNINPLPTIDISDYSLTADFRAVSISNATAETVDFEVELKWAADNIKLTRKIALEFVDPS